MARKISKTKESVGEAVSAPVEPKKGLDIKVKASKEKGKVIIKVTLLQDGKEVASDYDWVYLDA